MQNIDISKAKGILFKTEMVRALLEGRKNQTRRIVKSKHESGLFQIARNRDGLVTEITSLDWDEKPINNCTNDIIPKYKVGDILYVKETWAKVPITAYGSEIIYKATFDRTYAGGWKPSLFMPKEAARIFLKVTSVKVERVQDITEEDAIAEGFNSKSEFLNYFDKLNKSGEKNPYVWVYGFDII